MKIRKQRNRRAAFTLMEMMVVVAIIVALAGIGIFYMAGQAEEGNKTKAKADIKNLTQAATAFKLNHPDIGWPQDLQSLLQRDDQGHGPYLTSAESLMDPWNRPYQYDAGGSRNNGLQPDIYTTIPNGQGIIGNWSIRIVK